MTSRQIEELHIPIPEGFCSFKKSEAVKIYIRNLPHWRQEGAVYFVTFRTLDSIPKAQWINMLSDRQWWKAELKAAPDNAALLSEYFQFQRKLQARIENMLEECHGACLLQDPECQKELVGAIEFYEADYYKIHSAVVMPNHCHLAIQPNSGVMLENIIGRIKSWSARKINEITGQSGGFWMEECFDHIIRTEENYQKTIRYILMNPIKANLKRGQYWYMGPLSELM